MMKLFRRLKESNIVQKYDREIRGGFYTVWILWMLFVSVSIATDMDVKFEHDIMEKSSYIDQHPKSLWNDYCGYTLTSLQNGNVTVECVSSSPDLNRLVEFKCEWNSKKAYKKSLDYDRYSGFEKWIEDTEEHCEVIKSVDMHKKNGDDNE